VLVALSVLSALCGEKILVLPWLNARRGGLTAAVLPPYRRPSGHNPGLSFLALLQLRIQAGLNCSTANNS